MDKIREAKQILDETINLARRLYGKKWIHVVEELEDLYEGDPFEVLEHLRREARRRGLV
ncbi:MAG: hypothetical protein GSR86_06520 [Desulfurococcales archaeon]|nr:hypothetical protein [Desulfurococcales archaeon]